MTVVRKALDSINSYVPAKSLQQIEKELGLDWVQLVKSQPMKIQWGARQLY